jgi:hypothetical protein
MEDLADEGCVVPIFIRCLGHPSCDAKFGQNGPAAHLARNRPFRIVIRLPGRGPGQQDPAMTATVVFPPLLSAAAPAGGRQQPGRPRRCGPPRP